MDIIWARRPLSAVWRRFKLILIGPRLVFPPLSPPAKAFFGLNVSKLFARLARPAGPRSEVLGRAEGRVSLVFMRPRFSLAEKKFVRS